MSNNISTSTPYTQVSAWVQLIDPSCSDPVTGFEFRLEVISDGPDPILVWQLPPQSINILQEPSFMVGLGTPLAIQPRITLAEVLIVVPEAGQSVWLFLHPVSQPSLLDPPGYGYPVCDPVYSWGDNNSFVTMPPITQCTSEPVASINPGGQQPEIQLPELPPVIPITVGMDDKLAYSLILNNEGPISYTGIVSMTGDTPVQLRLNGNALTDDPTAFQVPVGESIIVTPYYDGAGPVDAALQLDICDELWSIPLLSADELKICEWSVDVLDFGEVPYAHDAFMEVTLFNTGYEELDIPMEFDTSHFHFVSLDHWENILPVGRSCTYRVRFFSYVLGPFHETAIFDDCPCPLELMASSIEGLPECELNISEFNFEDVIVGEPARNQRINIKNVGGGILQGAVTLLDTTGTFSLNIPQGQPFSVNHLHSIFFHVYFSPSSAGIFSAQIDLGLECDPIVLTGHAIDLEPECEWYGSGVENGVFTINPIPVGGDRYSSVRLINVGGGLLEGELSLDDTTGIFQILSVPEFSLGHSQAKTVHIKFSPELAGVYTTVLHTGSICGEVEIVAEGLESYGDCDAVGYSSSSFNRVSLGDTVYSSFRINNTGYMDLHGDLSVTGEGFELQNPGPFILQVGEILYEQIMFVPEVVGQHSATVSTGLELCPGQMEYSGFAVPAGSDQLGFFIDPEGAENSLFTSEPKLRETVYLVLQNPSAETQMTGWSITHYANGPIIIMNDWTTSWSGIIEGSPYRKYMTFDSPIPFSETMVLAEFSVLVIDHTEAGSVELGYGGYWYSDEVYPEFVRLQDPSDLNINSTKSNLAPMLPPPVAELSQGIVQLIWPCTLAGLEGYHVYRRVDQEAGQKLTVEPVVCSEGLARFTDDSLNPEWSSVHYSYIPIRKGWENLSSKEVALDIHIQESQDVLPVRTRLLNIYPNPFNPVTHISFELANPGRLQIRIYDVSGRLVRSLTDRHFEAGQFEETWDGRDDGGRMVPSNVYYARMTTGNVVQMLKMTLLK